LEEQLTVVRYLALFIFTVISGSLVRIQ